MSIPLLSIHYGNVFVHKRVKLVNRQILAKMHRIAPNCVSNFKNFPGVTPRTPIDGEADTPSPKEGDTPPQTPSRGA